MQTQQTLIGIQDRYIQSVLRAKERTRAMVRGKARASMVRSLASLGFTFNQIQYAIDDARDIATLEMIARKAGN